MNKAQAQEHLARADKNIKAAKGRIRKQEKRVKTLASDGHKTVIAEETLADFENLEETMEKHRDLIREELKRITKNSGSKTKTPTIKRQYFHRPQKP